MTAHTKLRLVVCEWPDEVASGEAAWAALSRFLDEAPADVVVLPEMPFCAWGMFRSRTPDAAAWCRAIDAHDTMIARFGELRAGAVLGSRPVEIEGRRLNQAFAWTPGDGYLAARAKYYLPEEEDGWEATWFARGDARFPPVTVGALKVGFQICTELLFTAVSHSIGKAGAHLIAAPRATGGHRRWPMAAGLAANMSGCFVASANRRSHEGASFPGRSWIVSPEGEILVETSEEVPFAGIEIDLAEVTRARGSYPRNLSIGAASL